MKTTPRSSRLVEELFQFLVDHEIAPAEVLERLPSWLRAPVRSSRGHITWRAQPLGKVDADGLARLKVTAGSLASLVSASADATLPAPVRAATAVVVEARRAP